jgi:hypothetical protein
MSNSETIESEITAEFCATVSCRFSRPINQAELGRNYELSKQPTSRRFEERTCEKEVQFNDEN